MSVKLEEMKEYLKVEFEDEDTLIQSLIETSEKLCLDILRIETIEGENLPTLKTAIMYGASYLYENRESGNHKELTLTLRSLLFGSRKEVF